MKRKLPDKVTSIQRKLPRSYMNKNGLTMHIAIAKEVPVDKKINTKGGKRGGWRPGAGRKKGSRSAATLRKMEFEKLMAEVHISARKTLGREPTSLECYQAIRADMRIPFAIREIAIAKALPFESSRLSSSELIPGSEGGMKDRMEDAKASLKRKLLSVVVVIKKPDEEKKE